MNQQVRNLLEQIAASDHKLAKNAEQLLGYEVDDATQATVQAMLPQLLMVLVLKNRGKLRVTTRELDTMPVGYVLAVRSINNGKTLEFTSIRQ